MMFLTVREYADKHGKTVQAVYKQLQSKTLRTELAGHIKRRKRGNKYVLMLDEDAQAALTSSSRETPTIVQQIDNQERLDELERQVQVLTTKLLEVQDLLIKEQQTVKELQQKNISLLEEKAAPTKKHWWQRKKA